MCSLHGYTDVPVNNLRYKRYRASGKVFSGEKLAPCFDSLQQHIKPANYQAAVWRRSLEFNPTISDAVGHGWSEVENVIDVVWNGCSPYGCSRKCKVITCSCLHNCFQSTDACHTHECENIPEDFINRKLNALHKEKDD